MGLASFFAKFFGRKGSQPEQVVVDAPSIPQQREALLAPQSVLAPDPAKFADAFHDQLATQAEAHRQLSGLLTSLTTSLDALPQLARQQGQVLETILENTARARHRDQAFEKNLMLLNDGAQHQTQVLGLVQQQLDLNHEVSLRVADSLRETAGALTTFAATSDRQVKAIELLAQSTQRRVTHAERLEKAMQFWMAVVAAICTLALIYAIYAATRGPVVIAVPQPVAVQPPAPVVPPPAAVVPPPAPAVAPETPAPSPKPVEVTAPAPVVLPAALGTKPAGS